MAERPNEALKNRADELAHLIAYDIENKERISELERELGLKGQAESKRPDSQSAVEKTVAQDGHVGIWKSKWVNGEKYYVRDEKFQEEFKEWAKVHEIPPKRAKKRILYLGESVARGYLLHPFFTPASLLEDLLNLKSDTPEVEVVDLARNDLNMTMLTAMYPPCFNLEPDVIVIFAGNNWLKFGEFSRDIQGEIVKIMETERGLTRLRKIYEDLHRKKISTLMKELKRLAQEHGVPVVFIIPEFNLRDWKSNSVEQINLWPKGQIGRWLELKSQAQEALKKGDIETAESLAVSLVELDESNPVGFEILAECKLKQRLYDEAAEYLMAGIDTAIFRPVNAPCCIPVIREILREEAGRSGIHIVDLPEVFRSRFPDRPVGRELFLDYCHLTVEGIQVAMAAAAYKLFPLLNAKEIPLEEFDAAASRYEPDAFTTACSHLFGAIHSAHRGQQPYEILYYHCRKALQLSGDVKEIMYNYIEMASSHTVWALNKNCEELLQRPEIEQFPYILQPHNYFLMDMELVDAMVDALKGFGEDLSSEVSAVRKREHGLTDRKINLLESYYHLTSYVTSALPQGTFYQAREPFSPFFLVLQREEDIILNFTYRVPDGINYCKGRIYLKVNDFTAAAVPPVRGWADFSLRVPGKFLKEGINLITIIWPSSMDFRKTWDETQVEKVNSILFYRLMCPSYGELYMFTVERA